MTEKIKFIIIATVAIILFIAIVITLALVFQPKEYISAPKYKVAAPQQEYCIKSYNGKIAVFIGSNTEPEKVLDSPYIRDLPEYDQNLLENGITTTDPSEVLSILEDYDN